jgi:hypothetical protein
MPEARPTALDINWYCCTSELILHQLEQLLHIGQPKLRVAGPAMHIERVKLPRRDLILFDAVVLGVKGPHVPDEAAADLGRQV